MNPLRALIGLAASGIFASLVATPAQAQDWPNRPMTMVVPFAAGGSTDAIARIIAARPARTARPAGHRRERRRRRRHDRREPRRQGARPTAISSCSAMSARTRRTRRSTRSRSTTRRPISRRSSLVDRPAAAAGRAQGFPGRQPAGVHRLRQGATRRRCNTARPAPAAPIHLACVLLNAAIGINVTHIPYRGGGPAMQDLIAGRIDYHARARRRRSRRSTASTMKALAMLSKKRSPVLPDLPSAHEQGLTDFDIAELERAVPAQGHAGRDRAQAQRRRRRRHEHAGGAGAAEGDRLRPRRAGAPVAGIPRQVRRRRDQEMGGSRSLRAACSSKSRACHEIAGHHAADGAASADPALCPVLSHLHRVRADHRRGARHRRPDRLGRRPYFSGSSRETRDGGWAFCREHAAAAIGKDTRDAKAIIAANVGAPARSRRPRS